MLGLVHLKPRFCVPDMHGSQFYGLLIHWRVQIMEPRRGRYVLCLIVKKHLLLVCLLDSTHSRCITRASTRCCGDPRRVVAIPHFLESHPPIKVGIFRFSWDDRGWLSFCLVSSTLKHVFVCPTFMARSFEVLD